MYAEITIYTENRTDNILSVLQTLFLLNGKSLQTIIDFTVYSKRPNFHDSFNHGFHAPDATLLFNIVGNELKIHIETPEQNNWFLSLRSKIYSYSKNIIGTLSEAGIPVKDNKTEVIIFSANSYIMTGKRISKKNEFWTELNKNKTRLIYTQISVMIVAVIAYWAGLVKNIESATISLLAAPITMLIWYFFDYYGIEESDDFKYEPAK